MRLTDEELVAAIEAEERVAIDAQDGELAQQRAEALELYRGEATGVLAPVEGRSSVVSRDLMDTVQWIVPQLARVYLGGEEIGKFDAVGPEDEKAAEVETQAVNWMIREKNDVFSHVISTLTDALLLKNGYILAYPTNNQDIRTEVYTGLADEEMAMLAQDPEVRIVEHSEYPDPMAAAMPQQVGPDGMPMPPPMLHDVKIERQYKDEFTAIESIPPEEVLVSRRHRWTSLEKADFVQWRRRVTIGQLRAEGFKVPDDAQEYTELSEERETRERFYTSYSEDDETGDVTRRTVLCKDTFLRMDMRNEGVPQLWRVVIIDGMREPILKEEADVIPIAAFSPLVYPHSHQGTSMADLVSDLMVIKSVLMRQFLDGVYLQNSGRVAADINRVNVDDLLVNRPGGVIRTEGDPASAIFPVQSADAGPSILSAMEYMESVKEGRTGVTRYSAGLDANTLNKTATGIQQIQSAANQRIELIARTLASGFRDLFIIVHTLMSKHSTRPIQIKLKGQWTPIDPRSWAKRTDFSISVGLGTGSPEVQMQKLMMIGQVMQQGQQLGVVGPEEFLNWFDDLCKAAGYRNPRRFSQEVQKDPQTGQPKVPPPPKDPAVQVAEIKAQTDMQSRQMEFQAKGAEAQQKLQVDMEKMKGEFALQQTNDQRALEIEKYKIDRQMELERFKAELQVQVELEKARIKAQADVQAAEASYESKTEEAAKGEAVKAKDSIAAIVEMVQEMRDHAKAPRRIVRGPDGKAIGVDVGGTVRNIERDQDGRAVGLH
jgi:hypothetical protein